MNPAVRVCWIAAMFIAASRFSLESVIPSAQLPAYGLAAAFAALAGLAASVRSRGDDLGT